MPDIDLLTISREEAIRVARAVFGMSPTEAEEFVTLARGEETSDIDPPEITIKAANFATGLHPRAPKGSPKGGQFIRKALGAYRAYNQKTRGLRQAEGSVLTGALAGAGNIAIVSGISSAMAGNVVGGVGMAAAGSLTRSAAEKLQQKIGKRHRRNRLIHDLTSGATTAGVLMYPGMKRGFQAGFRKTNARLFRGWQKRQFRTARAQTMANLYGLPAPQNHKAPRIINLPKSKYRFYEVGMKAKKLPKLGSGARFAKLEGQLAKKGIRDPGALAAAIGRKKYGAKRFAKLSAHGRKEIVLKAVATTHVEPKPILQIALEMRNKLPKSKKGKKSHKPFPIKTKAFGRYDEAKHKRYPKGSPKGGKFMPKAASALRGAASGMGLVQTGAGLALGSPLHIGVGVGTHLAMRHFQKKSERNKKSKLTPKTNKRWYRAGQAAGALGTVGAGLGLAALMLKESIPEEWPTGHILAQPLVFKDVNDDYRWVLLSSNGYRDRDGELITTQALERDVALWELEGQPYQPLRWWHVALDDDYQHGLELGQTDLRLVQGHTLIESGTFDDPLIGEAVFKAQDQLAASVGFRHSPSEPNADKMFEDVSIFERSLLPEAYSSNVLTDLLVTN